MPYKDNKKRLEYSRRWNKKYYKNNKIVERQRIELRKNIIEQWLEKFKSGKICEYCGESNHVCLQFHHIKTKDKEINISRSGRQGWSIDRIKEEIEKCKIVCSNCHRKIHAGLI
jgi:hypothetical protein